MPARTIFFVQTGRSLNGEPFTGTRQRTEYLDGAHGAYLTEYDAERAQRVVDRGEVEEWVAVPAAEYGAGAQDAYNERTVERNGLRRRLAEAEATIEGLRAQLAEGPPSGADGATVPGADDVAVSATGGQEPTWASLQKAVYAIRDEWDWSADDRYDGSPKREEAEAIYAEAVEKGLAVLPLDYKV